MKWLRLIGLGILLWVFIFVVITGHNKDKGLEVGDISDKSADNNFTDKDSNKSEKINEDVTNTDSIDLNNEEEKIPELLGLSQPGIFGVFDPSIESRSGKIYMSYSSARESNFNDADPALISIRLASSEDHGATWDDVIELFKAEEVNLPSGQGIWQYEVSSLVYDLGAPANERWKIFAFRYLKVGSGRLNEHSWISLKTSGDVESGWSGERKLFSGFIYDDVNNGTIGSPEVKLNELDSSLSDCAAFTEPGALSKGNYLYVSLHCATGTGNDRIVLVRLNHAGENWEYVGELATHDDAEDFGFEDFSAPDLVTVSGKDYVIVSPVNSYGLYKGCIIFKISNIANAEMFRDGEKLVKEVEIEDTGAELNGACTYDEAATESGILFFERTNPNELPFIKIYKSFVKI